jgi:hypothetical protein
VARPGALLKFGAFLDVFIFQSKQAGMAIDDTPVFSTWEDISYIVKDLVQAIDAISTPGMDMLSTRAAIARAIATMRVEQRLSDEASRLGELFAGLKDFKLRSAGIYI